MTARTLAIRTKALARVRSWLGLARRASAWPISNGGGGWRRIHEPYSGAWQMNDEIAPETVLASSAVYACLTLIASDIGKLPLRLVAKNADGIWEETESPAFSPVLRKPNRYQTRIKFVEQWITSKLIHGNTYVLKERDARGVVVALYVLDPARVKPLVAEDGSVYYELGRDDLAGVLGSNGETGTGSVVAPASEVIHDLMVALFHPLIGVSPLFACGLAALQQLSIQKNSNSFFARGSNPGGVLTAPGAISDETAQRMATYWNENFSGDNVGRVAVLGDGLKYEAMTITAADAQLIDQLKWTVETICSTFHVPAYMIGGPMPTYNNTEVLTLQYYAQCLQSLIESFELSLDEGLALPPPYGTEFDLSALARMDTEARIKAAAEAIRSGAMSPNEARYEFLDLGTVKGGDTPYMQQQQYSLAALAERDADQPFSKPAPALPPAPPPPAPDDVVEDTGDTVKAYGAIYRTLYEVDNAA